MTKQVQRMTVTELRTELHRIAHEPWSARHADLTWELAERRVRS